MDGKIDWNDIVTSKRIAYSNPSYASCRAGEKIGFTYGVVINDPLRTQRVKGTTFCAGILFDGPAYPLSITLLSCAILKAFGKGEVTSLS